jgi:outer membrane receptor protein involved in Fe transport
MKHFLPRLPGRRRGAPSALALLLALSASAQTVPPAPSSAPAAGGSLAPEPNVVELNPFVVTSDKAVGYLATQTLAGTRLNTDLKDIGAAVSVYTKEFLDDILVTRLEDILAYTTSTEGGGTNFSGVNGESSAAVREDPASINRVRALASATRTRDFFPSDIPTDTFNVDSLTISRGPNAVLAGIGSAGGVIDSSLRKAAFKDSYRFTSRIGSYESHREQVHINKVIVPRRLALRLDLLNDQQGFRQKPAESEDRRLSAALQYRVFEPDRDSFFGRGTVRANFETGRIEGIPTDPLTPTFTLANWFSPTTRAGVSSPENAKYQWWGYGTPLTNAPTAANAATLSALRNSSGVGLVPATSSVIQGFPLYTQFALVYANPTSNTAGVGFPDPALAPIQGFQGGIPATLPGGTGGALRSSGDPWRLVTGFVRTRLQDENIFNFYDNLMTGAFDVRAQRFKATDVRYEQLFLGGKAGAELAYNYQDFKTQRDFSIPTGGNDEGILVDVNYYLSVKTSSGQPILNPNFGRPFISTTDVFRLATNRITRESGQLTTFYKHDFSRSESRWARLLGKHTLTGLLFETEIERFTRQYASTWDPKGQINPQSSLGGALPGTFGTQVNGWFYLGPSLVNVPRLEDVRIQPISAARPQPGQTYTLQAYDPVTRSFVTGTSKPLQILQRLIAQREKVRSSSAALQSNFFQDHLTTLVGWREDFDRAFTALAPPVLPDGNVDESKVAFNPAVTQGERSWTKSVVGRVPYEFPGGTQVRLFWNQSGNFNPVGQRRNIWNEELGSPTSKTEERGVSFSAFRGKLYLRVLRYQTDIANDSVGVANPYNYISNHIGRLLAARDAGLSPADFNYIYPGWNSFSDVARALYTTIPARLQSNIGADKNFNPRFTGSGNSLQWTPDSIVGLTSTSDTESRGTEFEAIVNPTNSWRISLSVAKNEAVKSKVAAAELAFATAWKENLDTMYDGKLLPGARNPSSGELGRFYDQYVSETLPAIRTTAALSGLPASEIRKWRANLVTRYEFRRSGFLKGVSVGGAVRWQDKIGIGYPLVTQGGVSISDVSRPYWGPRETAIDLSAGYTRDFRTRAGPITWTLGINVRNLNAKDELIPIKANADGSWGTFRIPPERAWSLTNSFAF